MELVYVTERIISLAFPPDMADSPHYTMHLREVAHMLSSKHGDNFRVSERFFFISMFIFLLSG